MNAFTNKLIRSSQSIGTKTRVWVSSNPDLNHLSLALTHGKDLIGVKPSISDGRLAFGRIDRWIVNAELQDFLATTNKEAHYNDMPQLSTLGKHNIIAFASIVDVPRAREFCEGTLGLHLIMEEPPFALVFNANGIMLRLGMAKELPPAHGTVLGWQVPDIAVTVKDLEQAGVRFERYDGMAQDELGIWASPTGAKVAWFKDPDGNLLSLSEHPELKQ